MNKAKLQAVFRNQKFSLLAQYFATLVAAIVGVTGVAVVGLMVLYPLFHTRVWYGDEPIYKIWQFITEWALVLLLCLWVVIYLVVTVHFLQKPVRQLNELLAAAQRLATPTEEPILLSPDLKQAETQLNLAREQALRAQAAAHEAEQRKNDLVVYLAHDLKTPLTSVIGYLTLLCDEPQLSPELRARYTGIALDKAERLEDLINEFFDITRFSLSSIELDCMEVDLVLLLQQLASEFEPILTEQNLTCTLALPAALPCTCDPDKMARVFDNLLRNAAYYSTPGSDVTVRAIQQDDAVTLTFTNHGRTIPQEKLDRIFERFFRLDASRASHSGGAGLGLAIAREIVEAHGGQIAAASAEETITFTVTLPVARKS